MDKIIQSISLRNTKKGKDKTYKLQLIQTGDGWNIKYQFGKTGSTLRSSTKFPAPVKDQEQALKVFNRMVQVKINGGYEDQEESDFVIATTKPKVFTGFEPQLPSPVSFEDAIEFYHFHDGKVVVQTKWDGERRGIKVTSIPYKGVSNLSDEQNTIASNKLGHKTNLNPEVATACNILAKYWEPFEIDCEDMGDYIVVFDVLTVGPYDIRPYGFRTRINSSFDLMQHRIDKEQLSDHIVLDHPYYPKTLDEYIEYISLAQYNKEEGVIIRTISAKYTPGYGKEVLKLKFYGEATVKVFEVHPTKRSVAVVVRDNSIHPSDDPSQERWMGSVTIPPNKKMPEKGDFIDIRYLHVFRAGSFYQPVYTKPRPDKELADEWSTLKFKKGE